MAFSLLNNYQVKVVSFVIAVFIWFFVITENDYQHIIEVPLNTVNIPQGKVLANTIPENIKVRVKGSGKDLLALSVGSSIGYTIDLSEVRDHLGFELTPGGVSFSRPAGAITATEIIYPDTVHVEVDELAVKTVPIIADISAKPAMGHTIVGELHLVPDSVTVSGPESIVSELDYIKTENQTFQNLKFDFSASLNLSPPVSDLVELTIDQTEVFLSIQKISQRQVSGIPILLRNAPENSNYTYYVTPSTLSMVLEGGGELLANLNPQEDIEAYIDFRRIRSDLAGEHPPIVLTPSGISFRDLNPRTVTLVHERSPRY
jgi:YbbR domain-containing protein